MSYFLENDVPVEYHVIHHQASLTRMYGGFVSPTLSILEGMKIS